MSEPLRVAASPVATPREHRLPPVTKGKEMNILAVNPIAKNADRLPLPCLGILYIASFARKRGYTNWRLVDNDVVERKSLNELEPDIAWADVVALTGTTAQCQQAMQIAILAKSMGKIVVYGGPHATPTWHLTLEKEPSFDFIAVGEGEETFTELLDALVGGHDVTSIPGLAFRYPDGEIFFTGPRKRNFNLDELPFPARDLLKMDQYGGRPLKRFSGEGYPYAQLIMSRGCTDKCDFCNTPRNWGGPVARSAGNLFAEMLEVYHTYGVRMFHFQDDVFTVNPPIVRALCYLLIEQRMKKNDPIHFEWSCLVRPDQFDYDLLCLMKLAGCVQIEIGVESGSNTLLKASHKRYTRQIIQRAFNDARRAGVPAYAFYIVGLPGETIWTWLESIIFAKFFVRASSSVWTVLTPYPGTRIYAENLVDILDPDFWNWLYKTPVVKVGKLGPKMLWWMRAIANFIVNGPGYTGAYRNPKTM
jgi:anaerobic magnesium-protoporphyrin IX monomethyl ester cyclase